ncbi:hypothetical protein [Streptomyces sp. NPDC056144]|uniref:hypothetical protein n=1 Tax=unclassified Streptomyces TaxID=2593676 RepID=UPI0035E37F06
MTLIPSSIPSSALRTELRRGIGPWTAVAVALTVLIGMFRMLSYWHGRWADATNELHLVVGAVAGPLALAAGCWHGGRDRRRGTTELWESVPRSSLRRLLVAAAPSALWPVAGVLLADTVCLVSIWPNISGGRVYVELLAADAVAVGALGLLGHVAGRAIRWRLTAPLLGVVGYVVIAFGAFTQSGLRWLGPAGEHRFSWDSAVWWFAPVSMAWTAGLACAALLAYGLRPARLRPLALVPLAVAVGAATLILRLPPDEGPWRPDPALIRPVCDSGTPQVCVSALDAARLSAVSAALAPLNARLQGVPGAPARWVAGPGGASRPGDRSLPEFSPLPGPLTQPAAFRYEAALRLVLRSCPPGGIASAADERANAIHEAVVMWLAPAPPYIRIPADTRPHLDRLTAKSPDARRAYLARYLTADPCSPEEVPVP